MLYCSIIQVNMAHKITKKVYDFDQYRAETIYKMQIKIEMISQILSAYIIHNERKQYVPTEFSHETIGSGYTIYLTFLNVMLKKIITDIRQMNSDILNNQRANCLCCSSMSNESI